MLLKKLNLPNDLHTLDTASLTELCAEVRSRIIEVSLQNGGHIGASLGAVEVIVALLKVFDAERDKIVFDVGHQAYAYKILTGRNAAFDTLRTYGGISGFPKPSESKYDAFVGGHAGNAVSAACGFAYAAKLSGIKREIISVIGDGVMVNGETAEGLNLAAICGKQIIVINDNTYSISANVGTLPQYLATLRKRTFGGKIDTGADSPFCMYDVDYIGAVDGHDMDALCKAFLLAKNHNRTVIVHTVTSKGKGYLPAEQSPLKLHGVPPKGEAESAGFGSILGATLSNLCNKNNKIVAIAAAMASSAGLNEFIKNHPDNFIDVGIAESTAVTVAAAMARDGYKPFVAIYSTFLQRAYDQLLYDVGLDNLDVTFCVDRAGLVGEDGESHQGVYDKALFATLKDAKVLMPASIGEFETMLEWCAENAGVKAIRYPRGGSGVKFESDGEFTRWQLLKDGEIMLLCAGAKMLEVGLAASDILQNCGISAGVVNARLMPYDKGFMDAIKGKTAFMLEDTVLSGSMAQRLAADGYAVIPITLPDGYFVSGKVSQLFKAHEIDAESVAKRVIEAISK